MPFVHNGRWSRHFDACTQCGDSTPLSHGGHGLCNKCYRTAFFEGATGGHKPCCICGKVGPIASRKRCPSCYQYFKVHGFERGEGDPYRFVAESDRWCLPFYDAALNKYGHHRVHLEKSGGRFLVTAPAGHPRADKGSWPTSTGFIYRAVAVLEKKIGRNLGPREDVHHEDENKMNDHPDNLTLMERSEHRRLHAINRRKHGGNRFK